jgi:hypothetical protein
MPEAERRSEGRGCLRKLNLDISLAEGEQAEMFHTERFRREQSQKVEDNHVIFYERENHKMKNNRS